MPLMCSKTSMFRTSAASCRRTALRNGWRSMPRRAEERGLKVIIAGAGGAAHLPGMVAANTVLPVLGVPVESRALKGIDSLLSIVQMPGGVPVGTLAIGKAGATNAGLLAVAILANTRPDLRYPAARVPRTAGGQGPPGRSRLMNPILPGATIGVLGSGQLGRMFAIAARRMGYRVHTYSPEEDTPTGPGVRRRMVGRLRRPGQSGRVRARGQCRDIRVRERSGLNGRKRPRDSPPCGLLARCSTPPSSALREKTFLTSAGLPVTPYRVIDSPGRPRRRARRARLSRGSQDRGFRLRRQRSGPHRPAERRGRPRGAALGLAEAVLEAFIDFECEVSVVAARGIDGAFVHYGVVENRHSRHILDVTVAPACVGRRVAADAVEIARTVLDKLQVVGVLCVEFFLTRVGRSADQRTRPAAAQLGPLQLRCLRHQPVRTATARGVRPAARNHRADASRGDGQPVGRSLGRWRARLAGGAVALRSEAAPLWKTRPRPGRKMGHVTALADDTETALASALAARSALV